MNIDKKSSLISDLITGLPSQWIKCRLCPTEWRSVTVLTQGEDIWVQFWLRVKILLVTILHQGGPESTQHLSSAWENPVQPTCLSSWEKIEVFAAEGCTKASSCQVSWMNLPNSLRSPGRIGQEAAVPSAASAVDNNCYLTDTGR